MRCRKSKAPDDINELRKAYCAEFVRTGKLDYKILIKLRAYVKSVKPRVPVKYSAAEYPL